MLVVLTKMFNCCPLGATACATNSHSEVRNCRGELDVSNTELLSDFFLLRKRIMQLPSMYFIAPALQVSPRVRTRFRKSAPDNNHDNCNWGLAGLMKKDFNIIFNDTDRSRFR